MHKIAQQCTKEHIGGLRSSLCWESDVRCGAAHSAANHPKDYPTDHDAITIHHQRFHETNFRGHGHEERRLVKSENSYRVTFAPVIDLRANDIAFSGRLIQEVISTSPGKKPSPTRAFDFRIQGSIARSEASASMILAMNGSALSTE